MGHLCSCHRQPKGWKTDTDFIRKITKRCSYLNRNGRPTHPFPLRPTPPGDRPTNDAAGDRVPPQEGRPTATEADDDGGGDIDERHAHRSFSSPASPVAWRTALSKPPRVRSVCVDGRRRRSLSQLDTSFVSDASISVSGLAPTDDQLRVTHSLATVGSKHATDLLVSSGVQPEVLVDYLRRRDVINEVTASAVRRCATRRAACELLAEVVASKGHREVATLCDGLRATGSAEFADCLEVIDAILELSSMTSRPKRGVRPYSEASFSFATVDELKHASRRPSSFRSCACKIDNDYPGSGNANSRSSIDVDVVYVDTTTGSNSATNDYDDDAGDRNKIDGGTSRASAPKRPRSMFLDPETVSLPPRPFVEAETSTVSPRAGRVGVVPVVSVSLNRICIDDDISDRLCRILFRFRSFRILSFVKCHRVGSCLTRVRQAIADRKSETGCRLLGLHIRLARFDDADDQLVVADVAAAILRTMRELTVTGSGLRSAGCEAIARDVVAGSRCLSDLDVSFNDVADVDRLSDALAANCSLRRLRMRGNALGCRQAAKLFDALRRNYRLELLDVGANPIGAPSGGSDPGSLAHSLAETLLCNRTLRELNLERCMLGPEACRALSRALRTNTTLAVLDVSANPEVGDLGASLIADALRHNRRSGLRSLAINACAVGDVGFRSLLEAIRYGGDGTTKVKRIKLCYNCIGTRKRPASAVFVPAFGDASERRRRVASALSRPSSGRFEQLQRRSFVLPVASPRRSGGGDVDGSSRTALGQIEEVTTKDLRTAGTARRDLSPAGSAHPGTDDGFPGTTSVDHDQEEFGSVGFEAKHRFLNTLSHANLAPEATSTDDGIHQADLSTNTVDRRSTRRPTSVTWGHSVPRIQSALAELQLDPGRRHDELPDFGRRRPIVRSVSAVLKKSTTSCSPVADDVGLPVDDGRGAVYRLLCEVLGANPDLKVLLWGNEQCCFDGLASANRDDDADSDVVAGGSRLRPDVVVVPRRMHTVYSTLPRNCERGPLLSS